MNLSDEAREQLNRNGLAGALLGVCPIFKLFCWGCTFDNLRQDLRWRKCGERRLSNDDLRREGSSV